jgi:hypothetical protein
MYNDSCGCGYWTVGVVLRQIVKPIEQKSLQFYISSPNILNENVYTYISMVHKSEVEKQNLSFSKKSLKSL